MKSILLIFLTLIFLKAEGISIQLLNDIVYNTDEQRTGGFKVLYQTSDEWSFHAGQDIYTPRDKNTTAPITGQRPYNAWLYAGVTYQHDAVDLDTLFSFKFDLGSRGPRALGKNVQNGLHDLIKVKTAKGWDSQTEDEYGNLFTFMMEHSLVDLLIDSRKELTHLSIYGMTEAGKFWRTYTVGISAAFGYNTPYYNSLINFPEKDTFYVFGDIQVSSVEKNRLLDGNSNYNVEKNDYLRKFEIGLNWDIDQVRFRFRAISMGREFTTQREPNRYGLLEITFSF